MSESDMELDLYHIRNDVARLQGFVDDLRAELDEVKGQLQDERQRRRVLSSRVAP